jgi:hypothetical protein
MTQDFDNSFAGMSGGNRGKATRMLLAACALTIALYFVPFAGYVTYPLRILVTFIHEGSHALMTLLMGGFVHSISIQPDGSGLTLSSAAPGIPQMFIASAGYLGATFYGAAMIGLLRRGVQGRTLLIVTSILVALVTIGVAMGIVNPVTHTFNFFGLMWGCLLAPALFIAGLKLSKPVASWVAAFIGIQCVANAFYDLNTLFQLSISTGAATDAQNMQKLTFLPAAFWAGLWLLTAVGMLAFVLRPARRRIPAVAL